MSYIGERPWSEPERYGPPAQQPDESQKYTYFVSGKTFFRAALFWCVSALVSVWLSLVGIHNVAAHIAGTSSGSGVYGAIMAVLCPMVVVVCCFAASRAFRNWAEYKKGELSLIYGRRK